jgi:uncharacterized protein
VEGVSATPPPERPGNPQRRCIVTGEIRDRGTLLRFVVGPDGAIVPDIEARLPGRGLWLTPRRDIVERAVAKRIFARAARRSVSASPELADRIESLLARRCYDAIGLARRAGLAVAGFERVGDAVRRGQVGLLLVALDGAEGGHRKLNALGRGVPSARVLTAAELGGAFGRERTVHAAIAGGPLCRRLLLDLTRLAGLRAEAAVDLRADPGVDRGVDNGMDFAPAGPAPQDGGTETHD